MNTKEMSTALLLITIIFTSIFGAIKVTAEEKEHPGIYLRHIIYFANLTTAEKAHKTIELESFFKPVVKVPNITKSAIYNKTLIKDVSVEFPMPNTQYLSYFGRGMTDEERAEVQSYKTAVIFDFLFPLSLREKSILKLSQAILDIANQHSGYIWDSETRELFKPSEWKIYRVDSWIGENPNVKLNTVIHALQDDNGYRAITLGMAKFGLPDLVVNGFEWKGNRSISSLINLTSQQMVERGLDSFVIKLDIKNLKNSSFKNSLLPSLYENAITTSDISLVESKPQDGDPDNFLLEFDFSQYEGSAKYQKQTTLLNQLFGWKDEVSYVKHNAMIEAASSAARAKLPELKRRFNGGLEIGESLSLKAPFETESGSNEWMWVEVLNWKSDQIEGRLRNIPRDVPKLREGDKVTVFEKDVFDYIFYNKDGTTEGNKTAELILKFQQL